MKFNRNRILWITETAVLLALLVAVQWLTAGTSAFAGQYITGSCVNAVLGVAAGTVGIWGSLVVALLSPFFAFLLGIGPKLVQLVPAIAVGNGVYVAILSLVWKGEPSRPVLGQAVGLGVAAVGKFLTLYLLVVRWLVPMLSAGLSEVQQKTFSAMFSWPQLVTALLGGILALLLVPVLKKALKRS